MMSTSGSPQIRVVLFDLDGTLVDSAPDLAGAANLLRGQHGLPPLPYSALRPMVGTGARGMVHAAFGLGPDHERFIELRDAFLDLYAQGLLEQTKVFDEMALVIDRLDAEGIRWGIVTNKATRFATPIVDGLQLNGRSAVLIAGDTTPHAKPHPEPLWAAARHLQVEPAHCVYVGDDERDIVAGRAAGMRTLAAAWGYLGQGEPIHAWGADATLSCPAELLQWLELA